MLFCSLRLLSNKPLGFSRLKHVGATMLEFGPYIFATSLLLLFYFARHYGADWRDEVINCLEIKGISEPRIRAANLPKDLSGYWFYYCGLYSFTVSRGIGRKEKRFFVGMAINQIRMGVSSNGPPRLIGRQKAIHQQDPGIEAAALRACGMRAPLGPAHHPKEGGIGHRYGHDSGKNGVVRPIGDVVK